MSGSHSMMKQRNRKLIGRLGIFLFLASPAMGAIDFENEILPILEDNCFDCHGPDKQKGGVRLDSRVGLLKGGDTGFAAIVPGDLAKSQALHFIKGEDPDEIMPPKGNPLDAEDVARIEKWIGEGAIWPGQMDAVAKVTTDHWSFQPVVRGEVPAGGGQPIDAFLNES